MSAEHPTNIPTETQQHQQQQHTSLFSEVVTVISGARQSANQEFNKFWDKYISRKNTNNATVSSPYLPIHFSEYDLACIREGRNIQGRLIPVSDKSREEVCPMDKDIVRSSEKRKISSTEDGSTSNILPHTKASKRHSQSSSRISPSSFLIPRPVFSDSSTPERATSDLSPLSQLSTITSSSPHHINTTKTSLSPIQSPAHKTSLTSIQSPVRKTTTQTSVSPLKYSPERLKNPIVTGSSKSVQTLASEIAIKLSPGGLSPFSPKKESAAATGNVADPFQSTPLVKTSTDISARKIAVPKTRKFIIEEEDERITRIHNMMLKRENDRIADLQSKMINEDKEDACANHVQNRIIDEDEVDERLDSLQNRIHAIQSAVDEFVSSPVEIISPKPIHTPLDKKIAALEAQVDPNLAINETATSVVISDDESISYLDVNDIPSPPLPSYLALNHAPSPSLPSYLAFNHVPSPPPQPETIVSSPRKTFSSLSPSPSRSLSSDVYSPKVRDPFNRGYALRNYSSVTDNAIRRFAPYPKTQDHIKAVRQLSTINKKNTSHENSSPNKAEPTLTHKLKMRSLVNAIPFCKLRKTDTITGPDGITRPNPFWKEIYGGR